MMVVLGRVIGIVVSAVGLGLLTIYCVNLTSHSLAKEMVIQENACIPKRLPEAFHSMPYQAIFTGDWNMEPDILTSAAFISDNKLSLFGAQDSTG